jgi:hypothetical protein
VTQPLRKEVLPRAVHTLPVAVTTRKSVLVTSRFRVVFARIDAIRNLTMPAFQFQVCLASFDLEKGENFHLNKVFFSHATPSSLCEPPPSP